MAIITISELGDGLGQEVARKVSQRLGFILVDSTLIISKLGIPHEIDVEKDTELLFQDKIPPRLIKKLIIKHALENNVVVLNLGGEILFRNLPGALHVKIHHSYDGKKETKLIKNRKRSYVSFIKKLYAKKKIVSSFYDLQIKIENMDADFAVDMILKAVETKGIMAKAGVTWRRIEKLKASLNELGLYIRLNSEKVKKLGIPSFAHPSEKDFVRVLEFYRIKWEYEPRSFPIEWDKNGKVIEEFTPDFYLPDLDTYIELTTLKQKLVTKKNRKLRRLRELYPKVNIKIFYGRDYKKLLQRFGRK
ncbi:MAG: hypothetical protein XU11_C0019G0005 [Candidatus Dadabacteria bacterium CSP1-2]|jgi:hypothetical protein|nr:MAG: hypothetical protein XU11_C0019G0005 [Candidatus Dadabacteria bacterium CSP1-2]